MRSQKCKHCTAVIEIAKPGGIHMQLDLPRSNFWSPTPNILALGWGFWEMVEPWATPHNKNGILGPRERDQWLKALTENLGLVFSTHMVTHNYPETPVPSNDLLRHQAGMWCIYIYIFLRSQARTSETPAPWASGTVTENILNYHHPEYVLRPSCR